MKRAICLILSMALLLCLYACKQKEDAYQAPVSFYYTYPEDLITFNSENGVIAFETREAKDYANDLQGLFDLYLKGPKSDGLLSPFPDGVSIQSVTEEGNTLLLTLSPEFAKLSGLDLTIACACLSMTALDMTEFEAVKMSVDGGLLDGSSSVTMTRESLLRLDAAAAQEDAA